MDRTREDGRRRRNSGERRFASDYYSNSNFSNNDSGREFGSPNDHRTWNRHGDNSYDFGEDNKERNPGNHRGKGPKGFTRSDDRIKEDINSRLTDDAYIDASDVEVTVANGEVTLSGSVPDRSSKRRAEDIVELVSGVSNVENRLRVK
ncbi:MAG: BON domain-containing protein [Bacteroidota bacterium]